ncbi:MAG TPA: SIS domain-containing protein [Polyangiaceae bacterium]|nr:SIS domain-containing protein [Polyangiaceae bacterium]
MSHTARYLTEVTALVAALDQAAVEGLAHELGQARERQGRVFVLGVGGSAANASHLVNDLRKLCGIEAYAPTDNVAELTARINDDGWAKSFASWLEVSQLGERDLLLVLSVGGGDRARGISPNLIAALELGQARRARIAGIVGRDGGYTRQVAHACVLIPSLVPERVTPHTEAFQAVIAHLLVCHPDLQRAAAKWESTGGGPA